MSKGKENPFRDFLSKDAMEAYSNAHNLGEIPEIDGERVDIIANALRHRKRRKKQKVQVVPQTPPTQSIESTQENTSLPDES